MEANRNGKCSCGLHESEAAHEAAVEARLTAAVETAIVRAVLPEAASRRAFLATIGLGPALAAISEFFPIARAAELAQSTPGAIEKKQLKIGFIPITCATPIIMAEPLGFYRKHGLEAEVIKTAGWAVIRDKAINKEYDAAHMLSPMPLAITLGAGAAPQPWTMPAIENINGQAITLSLKHKDKRDPRQWKGLKFAVPFDYSMHNYLLRYYVAEAGLDPTPTSRSARCRRRKWSPICGLTISTAFSGRIRLISAPCSTESGLFISYRRKSGTGIPAALSPRAAPSRPSCQTRFTRC